MANFWNFGSFSRISHRFRVIRLSLSIRFTLYNRERIKNNAYQALNRGVVHCGPSSGISSNAPAIQNDLRFGEFQTLDREAHYTIDGIFLLVWIWCALYGHCHDLLLPLHKCKLAEGEDLSLLQCLYLLFTCKRQ